jgi:hypothetical protein
MANILKQTVVQESTGTVGQRMIVQYKDDITLLDDQVIINYTDLSVEEKATFDAFIALTETKIA